MVPYDLVDKATLAKVKISKPTNTIKIYKNKLSVIQKLDEIAFWNGNFLYEHPYKTITTRGGKDAYSAYHIIFEKKGDCDASAHLDQIFLDYYGFETKLEINKAQTHASLLVKIEGKWFYYSVSGFLVMIDIDKNRYF